MATIPRITPCLWFDGQAEEAARYYVSIFPSSRVLTVSHYGDAGHEIHVHERGTVLTVDFELDGQRFTALNGGPHFRFNEAVSLQVGCDTQEELDHYWDALSAGGDPDAQQCGWLKDRYGLSWQVGPRRLAEMMTDPDYARRERVMSAILQMKKLDFEPLERAYAGETPAQLA